MAPTDQGTADRSAADDPPAAVTGAVAGCRIAHARLQQTLDRLDDDTVGRPSLLPGWTVGHLLTHVARNADSVLHRLDGARRGEVVEQYEGGVAGRRADIEAGARRGAAELRADVEATSAACDDAFATVAPDVWARPVKRTDGRMLTVATMVMSRRREVEVHHVDLGLGYGPTDWPPDFVATELPRALAALAARTDPALLAAWVMDRGPAPVLAPWDA